MKKLTILTLALAGLLLAVPALTATPWPPWFTNYVGNTTSLADAGSSDIGVFGTKVARFVYDTQVQGGTATTHGLGVYLPARAVIIRSYFKVITQFSDSGTGTVALSCEDANNIKTATDITGSSANAFVEGASTGAASAFVRAIGARCEITATVATATQDTGKLVGWVHYVMEE